MSHEPQPTKTDPELLRQLDAAAATDGLVEAVFSLRPTGTNQPTPDPERAEAAQESALPSTRPLPTPEEFESLTRDVFTRVEKEAGVAPAHVSIFRSLGSCAVSAPPEFIRKLMAQEEVISATASRQPEDLLIRPVGPSPAVKRKAEGLPRSEKGPGSAGPSKRKPPK